MSIPTFMRTIGLSASALSAAEHEAERTPLVIFAPLAVFFDLAELQIDTHEAAFGRAFDLWHALNSSQRGALVGQDTPAASRPFDCRFRRARAKRPLAASTSA